MHAASGASNYDLKLQGLNREKEIKHPHPKLTTRF